MAALSLPGFADGFLLRSLSQKKLDISRWTSLGKKETIDNGKKCSQFKMIPFSVLPPKGIILKRPK